MFFKRSSNESIDYEFKSDPEQIENETENLICVGIQNKWYKDENTKISYTTMRNAVNHFTSKMRTLEWSDHQLFFIFIINQSIYDYVERNLHLLFSEQIGIISATNNMLDQWLSPTVKIMVERFQTLSKNYPDHVVFQHQRDEAEITQYKENVNTLFLRLTEYDNNDPNRKLHLKGKKRENEDAKQTNKEKDKKIKISEDE
jgi:hypothetical protein